MDEIERNIARLGGESIIAPSDLPKMNDAVLRVFALMRDGEWHDAASIRLAAGERGRPASEGLRRMRELRRFVDIERRRVPGGTLWEYRITSNNQTYTTEERPKQLPLFQEANG